MTPTMSPCMLQLNLLIMFFVFSLPTKTKQAKNLILGVRFDFQSYMKMGCGSTFVMLLDRAFLKNICYYPQVRDRPWYLHHMVYFEMFLLTLPAHQRLVLKVAKRRWFHIFSCHRFPDQDLIIIFFTKDKSLEKLIGRMESD